LPNTIWIDVEDLFQYAAANPRPSGIQRIEYELCRSLATLPESRHRVRFVRHAGSQTSFYSIPYSELDALYGTLTTGDRKVEPAPGTRKTRKTRPLSQDPLRRLAYGMPSVLRDPLVTLFKSEREAGRALVQASAALARLSAGRLKDAAQRRRHRHGAPVAGATSREQAADIAAVTPFDDGCEPGDVLLVLGSPWFHPFYAQLVEKAQRQRGLRFALLVYDLIPLRRPEWCDHNLALRFREWTSDIFPLVDTFLTISRSSAEDITQHAQRSGFRLRGTPQPIAIGTGFTSPPERPHNSGPDAARAHPSQDRLPPPGSYALIVSTIEARKNHVLLFRVWRRLLEEMPPERVPTLVFAGRVGWLVSDLMQQLHNADFLDGKIMLVEDPSDDELKQLYAGCQFTLFPSLYEGWGLPVTESLSFGKPCIISRATSLPEAGGHLARYFDPENGGEAYAVIRHAIETPEETEAWAEQVRREFRTVTWDESARGILRALGLPTEQAPATDIAAKAGLDLDEDSSMHSV
jgi:glycosyltransferase involved in cell wall biosynthesis